MLLRADEVTLSRLDGPTAGARVGGGAELALDTEPREERRKPSCLPSHTRSSPMNTVSSHSPAASLRGSISLSPTSASLLSTQVQVREGSMYLA